MESESAVVEVFSKQLLSEESYIQGEDEMPETVRVLLLILEEIRPRKPRMLCDARSGLSPAQKFLSYIVQLLSRKLLISRYYERGREFKYCRGP